MTKFHYIAKFEKKIVHTPKTIFFSLFFFLHGIELVTEIARQLQYCGNVSLLALLFLKSLLVYLMDFMKIFPLLGS